MLKTYSAAWKKFNQFCTLHNVAILLPISQSVLCYFVAYLGEQGLSYQTIQTYLSGIRFFQIGKGLPEPGPMPKLKVVKNGVRKAWVSQAPKRVRLPITPSILGKIKQLWTPQENNPDIIMLWAASCVSLFIFFSEWGK